MYAYYLHEGDMHIFGCGVFNELLAIGEKSIICVNTEHAPL